VPESLLALTFAQATALPPKVCTTVGSASRVRSAAAGQGGYRSWWEAAGITAGQHKITVPLACH